MRNGKMSGLFIMAIIVMIVIVSIQFVQVSTKSKASTNLDNGVKPDAIVTVTDKQVLVNIDGNQNGVTTTRDYVIFTDLGAYECGTFFEDASTYGMMQVGHTYEIWTSTSFGFSYKANIVRIKEIKTK